MTALLQISRWIDRCDEALGKALGWVVLAVVLVASCDAIAGYFRKSTIAFYELQLNLFGAIFLLGAGYTLLKNEHIRIDIVNSRLPVRWRNWIEIIGHLLFVMPLCLIMIITGVPFFLRSFALGESSASAGGLLLWPAKLMVVACFVILLAQTLSELIKRVAIMRGLVEDPHAAKAAGHGVANVI